jgi:Flp pilus assembly protein TadG
MTSRLSEERGAATTELVLVTPLLIVLLLFVALAGRLALVRGDIEGAARDAARAASLARSPSAAAEAARDAAAANLSRSGTPCGQLDVQPDTSDFRAGGTVSVDVTCHVPLGDLILLRVPATRSVQATAVEVLDVYREFEP